MSDWLTELRRQFPEYPHPEEPEPQGFLDLFRDTVCEFIPAGVYEGQVEPIRGEPMSLRAWEAKHGSGDGRVY